MTPGLHFIDMELLDVLDGTIARDFAADVDAYLGKVTRFEEAYPDEPTVEAHTKDR